MVCSAHLSYRTRASVGFRSARLARFLAQLSWWSRQLPLCDCSREAIAMTRGWSTSSRQREDSAVWWRLEDSANRADSKPYNRWECSRTRRTSSPPCRHRGATPCWPSRARGNSSPILCQMWTRQLSKMIYRRRKSTHTWVAWTSTKRIVTLIR